MARSRSDKLYIVYQLTCQPTGERYIGKCIRRRSATLKSLKQRWTEHVRSATQDVERTSGWRLSQAIREHGATAFIHEVLELIPKRDVSTREAELINNSRCELNTKKVRT